MVHSISRKLSSIFVAYGESSEDNADIFIYICEAIISTFFSICLSILIAVLFGRFVEGILFIISFALLRRYVGGFHANTHLKCIVMFNCVMASTMTILTAQAFIAATQVSIIFSTVAVLGIFALAPLDVKSKTFSQAALTKQRKKAKISSTLLWIIVFSTTQMGITSISLTLSLSMLWILTGLVLVKIQGYQKAQ